MGLSDCLSTMQVVLALAVLVGVVVSQGPRPCTSPPQWMGREDRVDFEQGFFDSRVIMYDETNKRVRTLDFVDINSTRSFYDILELYNENKRFSINLRSRECNISSIDRPFRYRGVPPDARFEQTIALGAPALFGEYLQAGIFAANETDEFYVSTVTFPSCVPVRNIHITQKYGFEHSDYFDITAGISDPQAFIAPPECNKQ